MSSSQDTEITLGTGKMLVLFFALAAVCAVFFAMGYKLGKGSGSTAVTEAAPPTTAVTSSSAQPGAVKPAASSSAASPDLAYYKQAKETPKTDTPVTADNGTGGATSSGAATPGAGSAPPPPDPALASSNGYFVQVAAVSKQEDANALVDALKRKQYPAFAASGPDNLFHVQVGPFAEVKSAEDMRARLVNDGYNPILKK